MTGAAGSRPGDNLFPKARLHGAKERESSNDTKLKKDFFSYLEKTLGKAKLRKTYFRELINSRRKADLALLAGSENKTRKIVDILGNAEAEFIKDLNSELKKLGYKLPEIEQSENGPRRFFLDLVKDFAKDPDSVPGLVKIQEPPKLSKAELVKQASSTTQTIDYRLEAAKTFLIESLIKQRGTRPELSQDLKDKIEEELESYLTGNRDILDWRISGDARRNEFTLREGYKKDLYSALIDDLKVLKPDEKFGDLERIHDAFVKASSMISKGEHDDNTQNPLNLFSDEAARQQFRRSTSKFDFKRVQEELKVRLDDNYGTDEDKPEISGFLPPTSSPNPKEVSQAEVNSASYDYISDEWKIRAAAELFSEDLVKNLKKDSGEELEQSLINTIQEKFKVELKHINNLIQRRISGQNKQPASVKAQLISKSRDIYKFLGERVQLPFGFKISAFDEFIEKAHKINDAIKKNENYEAGLLDPYESRAQALIDAQTKLVLGSVVPEVQQIIQDQTGIKLEVKETAQTSPEAQVGQVKTQNAQDAIKVLETKPAEDLETADVFIWYTDRLLTKIRSDLFSPGKEHDLFKIESHEKLLEFRNDLTKRIIDLVADLRSIKIYDTKLSQDQKEYLKKRIDESQTAISKLLEDSFPELSEESSSRKSIASLHKLIVALVDNQASPHQQRVSNVGDLLILHEAEELFNSSVANLDKKVYEVDEYRVKGILEKYFRELVVFGSHGRTLIDLGDSNPIQDPLVEEADSLIKERNEALFQIPFIANNEELKAFYDEDIFILLTESTRGEFSLFDSIESSASLTESKKETLVAPIEKLPSQELDSDKILFYEVDQLLNQIRGELTKQGDILSKSSLSIFSKEKSTEFREKPRAGLFSFLEKLNELLIAVNRSTTSQSVDLLEATNASNLALEELNEVFDQYFPSIKDGETHNALKSIANLLVNKDQAAGFERIADLLVYAKKDLLVTKLLDSLPEADSISKENLESLSKVLDKYYAELIKVYEEEKRASNNPMILVFPRLRLTELIKNRNSALIALVPELVDNKLLDEERVFLTTESQANFEIVANENESRLEEIKVPRLFSDEVSEALESALGEIKDEDKAAVNELSSALDEVNKASYSDSPDNNALMTRLLTKASGFYKQLYTRYPDSEFTKNQSAIKPVDEALLSIFLRLDIFSGESEKKSVNLELIEGIRENAYDSAFPPKPQVVVETKAPEPAVAEAKKPEETKAPEAVTPPPQEAPQKTLKDLIVESLSKLISTKTNAQVPIDLSEDPSLRAIAATFKALNVESKKDNPDKEALKSGALDAAISFYESIYRKYEPQGLNITLLPTLKPVEDFLDIFLNQKLGFSVNFKAEVHVKALHKVRPPQLVLLRELPVPSYSAAEYLKKDHDYDETFNLELAFNKVEIAIVNQSLVLANNAGFRVSDDAKNETAKQVAILLSGLNNDYNHPQFTEKEIEKGSLETRLRSFHSKLKKITGYELEPVLAKDLVERFKEFVDIRPEPVVAPDGFGPVLKIGGAAFLVVALAGGTYKLIPVDNKKNPDIKEPLKNDPITKGPLLKAPEVEFLINAADLKAGVDLVAIKTKDAYVLGHETGIIKTNMGTLVKMGDRKFLIRDPDKNFSFVELETIAGELGINFDKKGLSPADIKKNQAAISAAIIARFKEPN